MTGVTPSDIQKIVNLKHAWEFILDKDIIAAKSDYHLLSHIARLVNEGFYEYGGRIRGVPVITGGTEYTPPIPMEADVKNRIALCTQAEDNPPIDTVRAQILSTGHPGYDSHQHRYEKILQINPIPKKTPDLWPGASLRLQ